MSIQLSEQAKTYAKIINREIDIVHLEKWYLENVIIGGNDLMRYLESNKDKYDIK